MKVLFDQIPLDETVSMTMNGAVLPIMAFVASWSKVLNQNYFQAPFKMIFLRSLWFYHIPSYTFYENYCRYI
jgi:hypothetical protein